MCLLVQWVAQKGCEARGPQRSASAPHRLWLDLARTPGRLGAGGGTGDLERTLAGRGRGMGGGGPLMGP